MVQTVHMPTLTKMVASSSSTGFTPANEALMFSIYYATVSSMEEDEVSLPLLYHRDLPLDRPMSVLMLFPS